VSFKLPSLTLLGAYLDDVTIAGSHNDCRAALEVISSEASAIGLRVNRAKSVGFPLSGASLNSLASACSVSQERIEVLGISFGKEAFLHRKLQGSWTRCMIMPSASWMLLRMLTSK
jgi:hypothetical protein